MSLYITNWFNLHEIAIIRITYDSHMAAISGIIGVTYRRQDLGVDPIIVQLCRNLFYNLTWLPIFEEHSHAFFKVLDASERLGDFIVEYVSRLRRPFRRRRNPRAIRFKLHRQQIQFRFHLHFLIQTSNRPRHQHDPCQP